MAHLKKFTGKENLHKYRVLVEDTDPFSRYFRVSEVPDVLTAGKNAFLINGTPELLPTTSVKVEIIDAVGEAIFVQPIRNYQEGLARVVSIEVYEDETATGPALLTIMGELKTMPDGSPIPEEWRGKYNVRWQKQINVQPNAVNRTKIRLYNKPTINVNEILLPYHNPVTGSVISLAGTGSLKYARQPNITGSTDFYYFVDSNDITFVRAMERGGLISVPSLNLTSSISRVFNSSSITLSTGTLEPFTNLPISISYQPTPIFQQTALTRSFSEVTITDLEVFSGDIARAKIYVRNTEDSAPFEFLDDVQLDNATLLTTQSLGEVNYPIGDFVNQDIINTYWTSGIASKTTGYTNGNVTASYSNARLTDSVFISNDVTLKTQQSFSPRYYIGLRNPVSFDDNNDYLFKGTIVGYKDDPNIIAKCEVYASGSAFPTSDKLGKLLYTFEVPIGSNSQLFDNFEFEFEPLMEGTAQLFFVVYAGEWHFSKIDIETNIPNGFNPFHVHVFSPTYTFSGRRFERFIFKAELYDSNNNLVPVEIISDPVFFDGGNYVFKGTDHKIEGEIQILPSGANAGLTSIKLTTQGFQNPDLSRSSGSAIFIGSGSVFHRNTPFFIGTDLAGFPQISLGDKLYGYLSPTTGLFVLNIVGTILITSGSSTVDLRDLIPTTEVTNVDIGALVANVGNFFNLRGTNSVSAGEWNRQFARFGNYTRGLRPPTFQTATTASNVSTIVDPFSGVTTFSISSSTSIPVETGSIIYNNAVYADAIIRLEELSLTGSAYYMTYEVKTMGSWTRLADATGSGQTMLYGSRWVTRTGDYSPTAVIKYPVEVPIPQTSNTLYLITQITVSVTPDSAV